ncbi:MULTISPECIES: hypothetical protein [Roseomonadaceae]|uniref:hypothetical protein n=1 Tax=Roseomonadaceae TaxID=3385906 RepID=UPI001C21A093|nr:hypothetical protein [Roseomonas oleicola]
MAKIGGSAPILGIQACRSNSAKRTSDLFEAVQYLVQGLPTATTGLVGMGFMLFMPIGESRLLHGKPKSSNNIDRVPN